MTLALGSLARARCTIARPIVLDQAFMQPARVETEVSYCFEHIGLNPILKTPALPLRHGEDQPEHRGEFGFSRQWMPLLNETVGGLGTADFRGRSYREGPRANLPHYRRRKSPFPTSPSRKVFRRLSVESIPTFRRSAFGGIVLGHQGNCTRDI
jgi:hypothetical protein